MMENLSEVTFKFIYSLTLFLDKMGGTVEYHYVVPVISE